MTVTSSFDFRLPRCPSSRVSSTGPAESAWAQGIHIVAGVSCIICEYPLTLICSLFYRWRGGKKKSNIALRSQPQRKTPLSRISLSFRKRQTVSGEMKGLGGEDVALQPGVHVVPCSWCQYQICFFECSQSNLLIFIYLINLHDLSVLNGHFNSTQQQQFTYEGAKKSWVTPAGCHMSLQHV